MSRATSATGARQRAVGREAEQRIGIRRAGHQADGRPHADDVVEVAGVPERSAHVAAVGDRQHARGERRTGAAARSAGALARIVGIAGDAVDAVVGVRPHPEFRGVGLADGDHAGAAQPLDQHRILGRPEVLVDQRSAGQREADRRLQVLERDRQPVQRAERLALRGTPIGLLGQRQTGVVIELGDDGVDRRVDLADARQVRGHHLASGRLARADERDQLEGAAVAEIVGRDGACRRRIRHRRRHGQDGPGARGLEELPAIVPGVLHLVRAPGRATSGDRRSASDRRRVGRRR